MLTIVPSIETFVISLAGSTCLRRPTSVSLLGICTIACASYPCSATNRLTAFNGQSYGYGDGGPYHAVDRIGGADRFDYDANGNMTVHNKGLTGQQTLVWDAQIRLSEVRDNNGDMLEQSTGMTSTEVASRR